ncbi:MAG: UxaA family hydrolase [Clostridiales bacterium]|jgi:altronate dehydratase large subunit|nr:UxaA family hydrolase [Clostridiales bacterium]
MKITGYKRADGSFGIRNHLLIIPASVCAAHVAEKVASQLDNAVYLYNQHGCCQIGEDYLITLRTLTGYGLNPNVGAVLVVGLGCEGMQAAEISETIKKSGKPSDYIIIQELGGTTSSIAEGVKRAGRMLEEISTLERVQFGVEHLIIGLECGGSDPTSGLFANPAIGYVSTKLVDMGGTSILSETTEVVGAEHILAERFTDHKQRERFLKMVRNTEERAKKLGGNLREGQPTPGNKAGGITTIEEKSLGCMYKAGDSDFTGVLEYGELVPKNNKGLYFMDTPGQDIDSISGLVAAGAQIILFTTGRGTPTGNPICPVIKITGNPETFEHMKDDIDINAGKVLMDNFTVSQIGEEIFSLLLEVSNGRKTKAELLGHKEFGIFRITGAF